MERKVRKYLKCMLCSILTVAMILAGSSIPQMDVFATEVEVQDAIASGTTDKDVSTQKDAETEEKQQTEEETEDRIIKSSYTLARTVLSNSTTDYIQGGDFYGLEWSGSNLGNWSFDEWTNVEKAEISQWADHNDTEAADAAGMALTYKADGAFEVYQIISALPAGTYKLTAYVKGATSAKGFNGASYSGDAISYAESDKTVSGWTEVTHEFTIKSDMTDYVVGMSVTAASSAWVCIDDVSLVCTQEGTEGYTLEELKTLYDSAAELIDGKTAEDFSAGYDALESALLERII